MTLFVRDERGVERCDRGLVGVGHVRPGEVGDLHGGRRDVDRPGDVDLGGVSRLALGHARLSGGGRDLDIRLADVGARVEDRSGGVAVGAVVGKRLRRRAGPPVSWRCMTVLASAIRRASAALPVSRCSRASAAARATTGACARRVSTSSSAMAAEPQSALASGLLA